MAVWNTIRRLTCLHIILAVVCATNALHININDTSNVIVEFSPYVSCLDEWNNSRYGIAELLPLISKVASRFSNFFIELSYRPKSPQHLQNSLFLSPLSVAKYNCQPTTTQKIQLYLMFEAVACSCEDNIGLAQFATDFSNQIEKECNETINTIFLHKSMYPWNCNVTECKPIDLSTRYKWAAWMELSQYCEKTKKLHEFTNDPFGIAIVHQKNFLPKPLVNCNPYLQNGLTPKNFFHKISLSDTGFENIINMTKLVETWKSVLGDEQNLYILTQAFDTYPCRILEPNGWWYLINDSESTKTEKFVFEERQIVARKVDFEENPRNFEWLRKEQILNKNLTGIVYSGRVSYEILTGTFCRLLVTDNQLIQDLISFLQAVNISEPACESVLRVSLVVNTISLEQIYSVLAYESNRIQIKLLVEVSTNYSIAKTLETLGIQYGYMINMDTCVSAYSNRPSWEKVNLNATKDSGSSSYVFTYKENSMLKGATRMFRSRQVIFKRCQTFILENRNTSTEVEFAMLKYELPYDSKISDFENSPWAMQNYVKYIYQLNNWAQEQNTSFFVGSDTNGIPKWEGTHFSADLSFGWFSYNDINSKYFTKPKQALELSLLAYPKTNNPTNESGVSSNQIILVVAISLIICSAVFGLGIYLMRRYYIKSILTQDEVNYFLKGNLDPEFDQNDTQNIPYDQNKYEISQDKFKIDTDVTLGSGEFGKVSRGTIWTESGATNVAIKTTNPQKFHKTILKGLLSEIKVLAYVGKHANITELLGANTENIKDGKVYIFVELCHLGSLEKFLRNMRTLLKPPSKQTTEENLEIEMQYVNTNSQRRNALDASLSNDFYRWSIEICNGMAYLAQKHVVHADLATRNVLLNLRREAKICDFGLSRRMYNYTNYVKSQQEPLPWKWMAPEALQYMQFNEKSDVWAYGITLWEIYSLGSTPYAGLSWDVNFVGMLENGLKPSMPDYDEKDMYEMMKKCWKVSPARRPKFSDILFSLTSCGLDNGDD